MFGQQVITDIQLDDLDGLRGGARDVGVGVVGLSRESAESDVLLVDLGVYSNASLPAPAGSEAEYQLRVLAQESVCTKLTQEINNWVDAQNGGNDASASVVSGRGRV